jgi:purine-binding chemotaxis protein CheW
MVDLVKIRKKAKELREKRGAGEETTGAAAPEKTTSDSRKAGAAKRKGRKGGAGKRGKPAGAKGAAAKGAKKAMRTTPPEARLEPVAEDRAASESRSEKATAEEPRRESGVRRSSRLQLFRESAGLPVVDEEEEQAAETEFDDDQTEVLSFALAGEQYAVDVERLVEIIVPRPWTTVPNAEETVIGIISLRGTIVTLLDLRRILGHPPSEEGTDDTRIIVVEKDLEHVGFLVDRVLRVSKIAAEELEPPPVVSAAEQNDLVRGVFPSGDLITIYLDLARVIG